MSFTLNGVPYTDTTNFLREVKEVIDRDVDAVVATLTDWVELSEPADEDKWDEFPTAEPIRFPRDDWFTDETTIRRMGARHRKYISKRKEVK